MKKTLLASVISLAFAQNTFAEKGSGIGRTFTGISPTLRIDNIFVSDIFSVTQFTRIDKRLSDHFPIFADVQLKK